MRYRKLTSTGDYSFGNGQLDFFINTPEGVGQKVKTFLLLWLGEWFLNTDEGTPFMQGILGKHSQDLADSTLQDRVLQVEEVTNISAYSSTLDPVNRAMSVTIDINTIYGPTTVQVANYANY